MKNFIINYCLKIIKKNKNYDQATLEKIEYGLIGIYLTVSKSVIIFLLALVLGILKETLIFLFIFNLIRITAFGIHAKKSWMCLISSILMFIGLPLIMLKIKINLYIKLTIGLLNIILIYIYSPADTKKRPIINKKRRKFFQIISSITAITFVILSIYIKINFVSNCFLFALILENILISPLTYKICKEPYNNYIDFLKKYPELA